MTSFAADDQKIDEEQLKKIITNIDANSIGEKKHSARICEELDSLKDTVTIGNRKYDNKCAEARASMANFVKNHDAVTSSLSNVISKYRAGKANSLAYVKQKQKEV